MYAQNDGFSKVSSSKLAQLKNSKYKSQTCLELMGNLTPPRPRYRTPQEPGTIDREEAMAVQKLDSDAQKHMRFLVFLFDLKCKRSSFSK